MGNYGFENIIFDLDGTIIDSIGDIVDCIKKTYSHFNLFLPLDKLIIGPPLDEVINLISPELSKDKKMEIVKTFREFYKNSNYAETKIYNGVAEVLTALKNMNKHLFIATNKPISQVKKILSILQLDYFEDIVTPDILEETKLSKTEAIALLIKSHKLNKMNTLMIGDTSHDIIAAKNNQIFTVGFTNGYGSQEELQNEKPTFIINHIHELIEIINN